MVLGEGMRTSADSDEDPIPRVLTADTETLYDALFTSPTSVQYRMDGSQLDCVTVGAVAEMAVST